MTVESEFGFEVDDEFDSGSTEEVTVFIGEECARFRIVYWEGTVLAKPHHDDIEARGVLLPEKYNERPAWIAKFRAQKEHTNAWARFLRDPTPLAVWFGAWRMRATNRVTERLCIVTDDEYGLEMGRAEGRFA